MSIFNRTRFGAAHVIETTGLPDGVVPPSTSLTPPRPTACAEALDTCVKLGVDLDPQHVETLSDADLVRLAYAEGWKACESRLASRDVADGIAQALDDPGSILERDGLSESDDRWSVRAVQQVVAYGVPK